MKKYILFFTLLSTVALFSCGKNGSHEDHEHEHETEEPHSHEHGEEEAAHSEHDGEDKGGHSDEIILTPEKAKQTGVETQIIEPGSFRQVITTSGQILSAQGNESMIVANVAGTVSFSHPVTSGMSVGKGSVVLTVNADNMPDGNPVTRAKIAYETAKAEYDRAQELIKSQIISQKEFNRIKESYENARLSYEAIASHKSGKGVAMVSPMNGYIKSCLVNEGDYVSVGQPLVSITQTKRLYLRAEVSEKYYGDLAHITSANFKTPYNNTVYQLANLNGKLLSYGKASGENSFFIPVTFEFDNKGDVVPGSFVDIYLLSSELQNVVSLPISAITEEQGLYFVYIQLDEEGYKKQEVKLGMNDGDRVQILSGIQPGQRVVVKGAYHVKLASASSAIPAHSHNH